VAQARTWPSPAETLRQAAAAAEASPRSAAAGAHSISRLAYRPTASRHPCGRTHRGSGHVRRVASLGPSAIGGSCFDATITRRCLDAAIPSAERIEELEQAGHPGAARREPPAGGALAALVEGARPKGALAGSQRMADIEAGFVDEITQREDPFAAWLVSACPPMRQVRWAYAKASSGEVK
jgi:hypothetical protein